MDQIRKGEVPKLPFWATVAFVARCGQRFLSIYSKDSYEPGSQRLAVAEALTLAQARAAKGGDFGLDGTYAMCIDQQYFDHYDLEALRSAVWGANSAANSTHNELCEDPQISRVTRVNLAVTSLACWRWNLLSANLSKPT